MKNSFVYLLAVLGYILLGQKTFSQYPNNLPLTLDSSDQVECAVGINPINTKHIVVAWNDYRNGPVSDMGWAITLDGGASWDSGWFDDGIDPSCGFDKNGNVFVAYYKKEEVGGSIKVAVRAETGGLWDHKPVYAGTVDKPVMTIDNSGGPFDGRVYITWHSTHAGATEDSILFSYATSASSNFVSPILLDSMPDWAYHSIGWSTPSVGMNSKLYITWSRMKGHSFLSEYFDSSAVMIVTSTNGGSTFSQASLVTRYTQEDVTAYWGGNSGVRVISMPTLASDREGRVFIALWNRMSFGDGTKRIKWFRSTDEGESWSSPEIIANMGGGVQFFPAVAASEDGEVYLTYMHSPASFPGVSDTASCFLIRSVDHGVTFSDPVRISDRYSNPTTSDEHHEYHWVAVSQGKLFATWTDYRDQNPNIYVSGYEIAG